MNDDFTAALARVQSDYGFYVHSQSDPEAALANYSLSAEERAMLSDPDRLGEFLKRQDDIRAISITISGTHDWVNKVAPVKEDPAKDLVDAAASSVRLAGDADERRDAALRLVQILG